MDLRESAQKLKEVIFLKKGTGLSCEDEERALKEIEDRIRQEEAGFQENKEALEEKEGQIEVSKRECHELKEKLIVISKQWQEVAMALFQAEREGEELFDERARLCKVLGKESGQRSFFDRSLNIGSPRIRWVDGPLDPVSEKFRVRLILDNRDYVKAKRPKKRVRKKPIPEFKFVPEQAAEFLRRGITLPGWMDRALKDYLKEQAEFASSKINGTAFIHT